MADDFTTRSIELPLLLDEQLKKIAARLGQSQQDLIVYVLTQVVEELGDEARELVLGKSS